DSPPTTQQVSYLGLTFTVPAAWPVITLAADPTTCVRFDRHAVYLGSPGQQQNCPGNLVGRTEALLVQPSDASTASNVDNTVAHQIAATEPGVSITALYGGDRTLVTGILGGAGLPAPTEQSPKTPTTGTMAPRAATATVPTTVSNGSGEGFDACTAPSNSVMSAWQSSYSSVGIYLGGSDMACAQPNLTPGWVATQASAGWHLMPLYVGPQAAFGELTSPSSQGVAAADDAISQAANLGLSPGNIIYYDMESYSSGQS